MRRKSWISISASIALLLAGAVAHYAGASTGEEFTYFGTAIDFWGPPESPKIAPHASSAAPQPAGANAATEPFPWPKYLDPKNREFFREGDYVPPEPFMEIVRSPTDQNLKQWFAYMDKRNELSARLQSRIREYVERKGLAMPAKDRGELLASASELPRAAPDTKRFRFRMYFDSRCPHCKKMFTTLAELQAKGFFVEARQIDSDPRGTEGLPFPTARASENEIQAKDVESVPLLLIGDLKRKVVYRVSGYQTTGTILSQLHQEES